MQIFKTDLFIINKNNGNNPNAHQILNKQNTDAHTMEHYSAIIKKCDS